MHPQSNPVLENSTRGVIPLPSSATTSFNKPSGMRPNCTHTVTIPDLPKACRSASGGVLLVCHITPMLPVRRSEDQVRCSYLKQREGKFILPH